jgi:hypothetical protein
MITTSQNISSNASDPERPWARRIAEALGLAEQAHRMTGRDAFALDHPDTVCLVLHGTLNVFLVEPSGRRHGLLQVGPGEIAFGVPADDGGTAIVAVPGAGAEIVGTDRAALATLSGDLRADLGPAIECWLNRMFLTVLTEPAPGTYQVLGSVHGRGVISPARSV